MPKLFGIPYMGSKSKIALDILKQLPKGKRFVDLFGGGFAMSHCALLTNRYGSVWYNDINPLVTNLVERSISGEFNYKNFKPKWVSRQEFDLKKDKDGYIKYCWSFGNSGKNYLFGKDISPLKEAAHNLVVFGLHSKILDNIDPKIYNYVTATNIHERRLQFENYFKKAHNKRMQLERLQQLEQLQRLERLQQLERLERLQQLQQLERLQQLQQLERLEISNISYNKYEYQNGDIVYLDPPYEGTADYGNVFDSKQFYDWCISRPYQVWFSSYKISDKRFKLVYAKQHRGILSTTNNTINFECLYTNK